MDNFDHEENTLSGIGGSHDTIMVLFQKPDVAETEEEISEKPKDISKLSANKRSLSCILDCQTLIKRGKFSSRAEIAADFQPKSPPDMTQITDTSKSHYETWAASRYFSSKTNQSTPSFSAVNSFLQDPSMRKTKIAFTPILPYVATEYDTIYTVMCNFQDVLIQKLQTYGPLWCDEGVYRLAKELQLMNPEKFGNIFLGLGGFHMEKVIIACCGKYLEDTGVESALVANEVYGPENVKSVMNGGNYVRGIRGMAIVSEVLYTLLFDQFLSEGDNSHQVSQKVTKLSQLMVDKDIPSVRTEWEKLVSDISSMGLQNFRENGNMKSKQFLYWNNFIEKVYPVLRDLTRSHREGDWQLHLSAIQRALPLVFAFDRTNYKRWLPLYFEDCLSLPVKYPLIYESFLDGEFVVKLSQRSASAIPMDQALESKYNKPAKSASGIIGMTRRKEAVCKWNLMKHEKSKYTNLLREISGINNEDEYSLHHEFSEQRTEVDKNCVKQLASYIQERGNPFDVKESVIKNLVTGKILSEDRKSVV